MRHPSCADPAGTLARVAKLGYNSVEGATYTVELYEGATKKAATTSTGGNGTFTALAPGTYKLTASLSIKGTLTNVGIIAMTYFTDIGSTTPMLARI